MKYIIIILLPLFTACNNQKKIIPEIEVIDTQMAEVKLPEKIKKKDSINLLKAFDLLYRALETEDGTLLTQLNTENSIWPASLNGMLEIPVYYPPFLVTVPMKTFYNKELEAALKNKNLKIDFGLKNSSVKNAGSQKDSSVNIFEITFSSKSSFKYDFEKVILETEYTFEFIKIKDSFKFYSYSSNEMSWQSIYPSIESVKAYFPKSGLLKLHEDKPGYLSNFCNIWYSSVLEACGEPLLYNYHGEDEIYRFTWLRSFHAPVVIKIQKHDFNFIFTAKKLRPEYKDYPAEVIVSDSVFISWFKWYHFKNKLNNTSFWNMPMDDNADIGTDGARWIIEGFKDGQYHFIDRWSAKESDFGKACLYLIKISNLGIKEEDIY